jgi:riboflavin kinase / FMN adenylyltransferase
MTIIGPAAPFPPNLRRATIAIGNFDGLHRGHQRLLAEARVRARQARTPLGLVTFEPHPRSFFRPLEPVFRLTPLPLKHRLAMALGTDFVDVVTFDARLANMTPEDFVRHELCERLGVDHVVTGYDFHFGHGRKGTPDTMRALGREWEFGVTVIDQVTDDDGIAPFSSSSIRDSLRHGHVRDAAHQLGYWWTVVGEVVRGDGRGRTIGIPTANIVLPAGSEPLHGIYAVRVRNSVTPSMTWQGAGYFGKRPTFDSEVLFLEVHLLDFDGDLYGRELMVEFIDLIRPDRRFHGVDELVAQMKLDCGQARKILGALEADDPIANFPLGSLQRDGTI